MKVEVPKMAFRIFDNVNYIKLLTWEAQDGK